MIGLVSRQAIAAGLLALVHFPVSTKLPKVGSARLSFLGVIRMKTCSVGHGFLRTITHAAMESLSAFVAKTFARLHCTPPIAVLIGISKATEFLSTISGPLLVVAFGGISFAIAAKLGEPIGLVVIKRLGAS